MFKFILSFLSFFLSSLPSSGEEEGVSNVPGSWTTGCWLDHGDTPPTLQRVGNTGAPSVHLTTWEVFLSPSVHFMDTDERLHPFTLHPSILPDTVTASLYPPPECRLMVLWKFLPECASLLTLLGRHVAAADDEDDDNDEQAGLLVISGRLLWWG